MGMPRRQTVLLPFVRKLACPDEGKRLAGSGSSNTAAAQAESVDALGDFG